MPAIADIEDQEFVEIRKDAEGFAEFRETLSRSLDQTEKHVEQGQMLDKAFEDSLGEVRWRAELLRQDLRDKTLARYLRSQAQSVTLGAVSTAGVAAAARPAASAALPAIAAQAGAAAAVYTLFAILGYRSPTRKRRLLRFYDILLDR